MGRNPFYAQHVVPIPTRSVLKELEDVYEFLFQHGNIVSYDDDTKVSKPSTPIYIRVLHTQQCHPPLLERSCSIYRKMEDRFPLTESIYEVRCALSYTFTNRHSHFKPFEYRVLELTHMDQDYYTTFCVRTDGAILNLESLSLRGYVSDVAVHSHGNFIVSN